MPIAMGIAAKAMGRTTEELIALISSGQLATKDFLPAFSTALRQMANENGALQKSLHTSRKEMDRFITIFQVNVLDAFDAGAESGLATFFQQMGGMLTEMAPVFRIIGNIFGKLVATIGTLGHMIYQVFRPFTMFLDKIFNGTNAVNTVLGWLQRALMEIVGVFVAFFGLIEFGLDKLEEMNGITSVLITLIVSRFFMKLLGVFSLFQKIFGFFGGLWSVITTGFATAATAVSSLGTIATAVTATMVRLRGAVMAIGAAMRFAFGLSNPYMIPLIALATAGGYLIDKYMSNGATEAESNAKKAAQASVSSTTTTTNHFENHVSVEVADEAKFLEKVLELNEQQNMMAGD